MWVITTDPVWTRVAAADHSPNASMSSMSSMANMTEAYQCWSRHGWATATDGAMLFPNDKAASEYLAANKMKM
ncbi:hypothetical protein PX52LOC_08230 [Limnoglobus roseus]|uniref:Uncharacterized protein n=2 Tax=Limnoglobus roseus TaxID=2598579 RepID=A0A5C1APK9_9BACT|nr:hypothetical protein PX52LOC_08230 [Limnoglobus roseus]